MFKKELRKKPDRAWALGRSEKFDFIIVNRSLYRDDAQFRIFSRSNNALMNDKMYAMIGR